MKDNVLNVYKIILLSIIAIILIVLLVLLLAKNTIYGGIEINGNTKIVYDEKFNEENEKIDIQTKSSDVEIKESQDDSINVRIYDNEKNESDVRIENKVLKIESKQEKDNVYIIGININNNPRIVISIPKEKKYDLNIEGESSDIHSSLDLKNVNINTKSGDISLKNTNNIKINSTSGDVSLMDVNNLTIDTTSGDVKINNIKESINLKTTSGDIKIDEINILKNSSIKTTSGDVFISKSNDIYFDTKVTSGDIKINKNNRHAETEMKIQTTSGDIFINN